MRHCKDVDDAIRLTCKAERKKNALTRRLGHSEKRQQGASAVSSSKFYGAPGRRCVHNRAEGQSFECVRSCSVQTPPGRGRCKLATMRTATDFTHRRNQARLDASRTTVFFVNRICVPVLCRGNQPLQITYHKNCALYLIQSIWQAEYGMYVSWVDISEPRAQSEPTSRWFVLAECFEFFRILPSSDE